MNLPTLNPQEIPFDHEESDRFFLPTESIPFVATPAALELYQAEIPHCLAILQALAETHRGIDRLQVFSDPTKPEALWIIDDTPEVITALLPSDY